MIATPFLKRICENLIPTLMTCICTGRNRNIDIVLENGNETERGYADSGAGKNTYQKSWRLNQRRHV